MNLTQNEVKNRIKTIKSIKKVTNAMKLISQSKFNKLKHQLEVNTNYIVSLNIAVEAVLNSLKEEHHDLYFTSPQLQPTCLREFESSTKILYVYVSPTMGLSGSYLYNLEKEAKKVLTKDVDCIFIGEKGYLKHKNDVNKAFTDFLYLQDELDYEMVNFFRHFLDKLYKEEEYKEIRIIYTHYESYFKTEVRNLKLLPLDTSSLTKRLLDIKRQEDEERIRRSKETTLFEGDPYSLCDLLVPHYLDALLFRILLTSSLSENSLRKNAMESSTKNADKLLQELELKKNKLRQTRITNEISEIITSKNNLEF